ncbi:MAG: glycosyltransferase family 39 protein, partial [Chloroflexi bacterium]|nr:glycosyltransferase family 39 protein [Chloroflexota bacterium]
MPPSSWNLPWDMSGRNCPRMHASGLLLPWEDILTIPTSHRFACSRADSTRAMDHLKSLIRSLQLLSLQKSTSTVRILMQHDDRQSDHGAGRQTGRGMSPWATAVLCVAALAALALAALPTLLYPLTRDQGAYAYQAEIMRQGGALFRDVWESKGPGVQMAYWLAFVLFGRSESAVRLFDVLYALLSAACVYLVAQETFQDRRVAACSAWLYAFCYYWLVRFHSMATPEAFMAPFLL